MEKPGFVKYPADIAIRWLTYKNESGGLLDFEYKHFERQTINIRKGQHPDEMYLVNDAKTCKIFSSQSGALSFIRDNHGAEILAKITCEDSAVYVSLPDSSVFPNVREAYRLISDQAFRRVYGPFTVNVGLPVALNEGDEIKLGRVKLVVRHLAYNTKESISYLHNLINEETPESSSSIEDNTPSEPEKAYSQVNKDAEYDLKITKRSTETITCSDLPSTRTNVTQDNASFNENLLAGNTCRICLCDDDDASGPLITPCKCKGTLTYVHLACIRSWIKGRLNCYDGNGSPNVSYFWQKLHCELCGASYPSYINIDNKETEFVDIEQPNPPYAVLEPENSIDRGYFIVSLAKKDAIIGRGHDCDVRLTDISVSRLHSRLYFSNGHFIIEDKKSKFGTMIHNSTPIKSQVIPGAPICLKVGNGILCISMKKAWRPFALCCSGASSEGARFIV
ncbi:hypothetical protein BEWA_006200 [Theileria equi strain WA]|uniref:FHA domain-containing protein n=1 Tax=Theileria equi strain WA TaxID=1537102 RepID=L0B1T5_THEEQ|nr:hypothetical protein BEWA_006200 [Theileria equi strain WA]AFZ81211.1 hypothetical protein BEWA_006200 [Theileria equi strain WA]|eukprot:XP_004830877.1 hypothetical protein BEWA_006200 [Theileria equi strain WA]